MFLGKTKETWKEELIDCFWFLLIIACIAAAWVGLTYGVAFVSGQVPSDAFQLIGTVLCLSFTAYNLLWFVLNHWKRHDCLLDLGNRASFRGARYWLAFCIIFMILTWPTPLGVGYLLHTSLCLRFCYSDRFIAKDGIRDRGRLVEWRKIESYAWERAAIPTLKLRTKPQFLGRQRRNDTLLEIPAAHCVAASEILEQYLPGKQRDEQVE
jgi:hypothetical protein